MRKLSKNCVCFVSFILVVTLVRDRLVVPTADKFDNNFGSVSVAICYAGSLTTEIDRRLIISSKANAKLH